MEEQLNEQTLTSANTTEVEEKKGSDVEEKVSLGKFKDVNALLNAYNSLEAEFTKRCQRVKELENALKGETKVPFTAENEEKDAQGTTREDKEDVLKEYLKGVLFSKQTAVIMDNGGVGVKAPVEKPKSIFEAGILAKEILK
ncbi:MAG: hypothetical protein IJR66_05640 [Clostridia bacterium]|nr:hypothetical protein [Clostridia bacterium]